MSRFNKSLLAFFTIFLAVIAFSLSASGEEKVDIPDYIVFPDNLQSEITEDDNVRYAEGSPELTEIGRQRLLDANPRMRTATTMAGDLPVAVDNSKLKYFPDIGHQGDLGTCDTFSYIYYVYTYMYAMQNDIDVKKLGEEVIFSPTFNYNFARVWDSGALTLSELPYSDKSEYISDPPTSVAVWEKALSRKPLERLTISTWSTYDEALLKEYLANGYIFNTCASLNEFYLHKKTKLSDNPASSSDDEEVGNYMYTWKTSDTYFHAFTLVGYNDDIWCDKNSNNIVDDGELGGFKLANSWGTEWGNDGFMWVSYSDFETLFAKSGFDIDTIIARDEPYVPELTLELTVSDAFPLYAFMTIRPAGTIKEYDENTMKLNYTTFRYEFNSDYTGSIVIDLTDYVNMVNPDIASIEYDWILYSGAGHALGNFTLNGYKLKDGAGNVLASANNLPVQCNIGSPGILTRLTYGYTNQTGPWDFVFDSDNGENSITKTADRGETIEAFADPVKEGYVFRGWYNESGEKISFPYYVNGHDSFTAKWSTNYNENLDINLERFEVTLDYEQPIFYRQFKGRSAIFLGINEKTAWKQAKTYTANGKTYIDISSMINNTGTVILQFKIGGDKSSEQGADFSYYFLPRQDTVKAKLDTNDGMTAESGYAKIQITGTSEDLLYREKTSDLQSTAKNQSGYIYLPIKGYRTAYVVSSKTDNSGNDGLSEQTAFTPGSKPVNISISAPAKAPAVVINHTNDSVKVKTTMEISFDKETWYPVSSDTSEGVAFAYYKDIAGISLHDPLLKDNNIIYIRTAATARKLASNTATLHLGYLNADTVQGEDLISTNGSKLFSTKGAMQYIPVSGGVEVNSSGNIIITDKTKWKAGSLTVPKSGSADYYVRYAATGAYQAGKVIKLTVKSDGSYAVDKSAKEIKNAAAPSVRLNTAQDSFTLKSGMEVRDIYGNWISVSLNQDDNLWYNPAIGGVAINDPILKRSAVEIGGIFVRKSGVNGKPASMARFVEIPLTEPRKLTERDFTTVDGKKMGLRSGILQYMTVSSAPSSVLENGILTITDKTAKWKTGQITLPRGGEVEYYVRVAASSFSNQGYVTKIKVHSNGTIEVID